MKRTLFKLSAPLTDLKSPAIKEPPYAPEFAEKNLPTAPQQPEPHWLLDKLRGDPNDPMAGQAWRYGNYCGPGPKFDRSTCKTLSDGSPLPPPKGPVDAACMAHDTSYCGCGARWNAGFLGNKGTSCTQRADKRLIDTLDFLNQNTQLSWADRLAAKTIKGYFQLHDRIQRKEYGT